MAARVTTGVVLGLVSLCASCAGFFYVKQPAAGAKSYVTAAIQSIERGDADAARDFLQRAQTRFPEDPHVMLWTVAVNELQGRRQDALLELMDLWRGEVQLPISNEELMGRIGLMLFRLGRWGESADYLSSGSVGPDKQGRAARALLTRLLPYVRRDVEFNTVEIPLREGELPETICRIGQKERAFVLDTGSSMTTITKSLAKELGVGELIDFGLAYDSLGRSFAGWVGVLPAFALGDLQLGPQPVLVVEDHRIALRDPFGGPKHSLDALVGLDILTRFQTTFDPDRRSVVFQLASGLRSRNRVAIVRSQNCLLLPVTIENTKLWFILDTGASHSSLTDSGMAALPGGKARATIEHRPHRTLAGRTIVVRAVPDLTLQVSSMHFQIKRLPVVDRPRKGRFPVHGVLGADLLMRCKMTIDGNGVSLERRAPRKE